MITASVVLYDTPEPEIDQVLSSIECSCIDRVFVIDHSPADTARLTVARYKKAEYEKHRNAGYGAGHNHGLRKALDAGSKYHLVINPDIYFDAEAVKSLVGFMDANSEVGLVMPKILFPNGDIQYLCKLLPTPMDLIGRRFIPLRGYTERHNARYEMRWSGYDSIMEIPCLSGCFMFMRCDVVRQTGGFDERYFLYAEDVDFCRRIGEKAKTVYFPDATVYHSYKKDSYKSLKFLGMHIASMVKYFNKWGWVFDSKRRDTNSRCINQIRRRLGGK